MSLRRFSAASSGHPTAAFMMMTTTMAHQRNFLSMSTRADLSRTVTRVKDEAKGQALDLAEMNDASRRVLKSVQDGVQAAGQLSGPDEKLAGKLKMLQTSLKAYNTRLANLQTEARALHSDAEATMKAMWGAQPAPGGETAAPPPPSAEEDKAASGSQSTKAEEEDFSADVPPVAEKLEKMNSQKPEEPIIETVEPEKVSGTPTKADSSKTVEPELEIEIEEPDEVDNMAITDITKELHEKEIDFNDCMDAKSLRKRYRDYRDGRIKPKVAEPSKQYANPARPQQQPSAYQSTNNNQSSGGQREHTADCKTQQAQWNRTPNTSETAVAHDPYPGGQRKMIDPQRLVGEVKVEIASENNINPANIDLWCGMVKLDDYKRLQEYPQLQYTRIEVRQKGDVPK